MTRTEKNRALTEECLTRMNNADREVYRPILEYALELGYTPKPLVRSDNDASELAFSKSRFNRTLLRILPVVHGVFPNYPLMHDGRAQMRLVFYASEEYSEPFSEGLHFIIEAFGGKYTGCYGCGRCSGELQGYTYKYPDGKLVFRCGRELIALPPLTSDVTDEVKAMMKAQDERWESELG